MPISKYKQLCFFSAWRILLFPLVTIEIEDWVTAWAGVIFTASENCLLCTYLNNVHMSEAHLPAKSMTSLI